MPSVLSALGIVLYITVDISVDANTNKALDKLHLTIHKQENHNPKALHVLPKVLPKLTEPCITITPWSKGHTDLSITLILVNPTM